MCCPRCCAKWRRPRPAAPRKWKFGAQALRGENFFIATIWRRHASSCCSLPAEKFETLLQQEFPPLINIGVGEDISIRDLAELISGILEYKGSLRFNTAQPDGTPRKLLDVSRMQALGWTAKTGLQEGIRRTYAVMKEKLHTNLA